jgi:ribosomal protein S18 acetylase RimI-like enzyme
METTMAARARHDVRRRAGEHAPVDQGYDGWSALVEANYCAYIVTMPGAAVADTPAVLRVRTTVPFAYVNAVVCRDLPSGGDLDALIAATRADYAAHGSPHSWYVTPTTADADAVRRALAAQGLVRQDCVCMAADLDRLPDPALPDACTIEEVRGEAQQRVWGRTFVTGFGMPPAMAEAMEGALGAMPYGPCRPLRRYLARLGGTPVATATLFLGGGAAGIYNVATLPAARGRGIATAVTLAALREGRAQGARVGVLHPSEMARSVYRRLGFGECCTWDCYREPAPGA